MPGVELEAFFGTDMSVRGYADREFGTNVVWDTPLTEGYRHTFLSTDPRVQSVGMWSITAKGLRRQFRRFRPNVVLLTAYAGRFHMEAWWAARAIGARVIIRHEASDVAAARSTWKSVVREVLLRRLYARIDGFAAIGTEARRHLLRLGVPEARLGSAPYCVDSDFFAGEVTRWMPQRESMRRELGIGPDGITLVFSGKLIPKKDPLLICAAVARLPEEARARLHFIVAGDGDLRSALESAAHAVLGARVKLFGFLNQSEIGRVYASGDVLVIPSRRGAGETWGLVVNEAMQFGLPVIAGDGVGCGPDLLPDQRTGRIFESGNDISLASKLTEILRELPAARAQYAEMTKARIALFTTEMAAAGIAQVAARVCSQTVRIQA